LDKGHGLRLTKRLPYLSRMDDQYAFGELDDEGKRILVELAARIEHQSSFECIPAEKRLRFTRKTT